MNLNEVLSNHSEDIEAVQKWCDEIYQNKFAVYFQEVENLYKRFKDNRRAITDEELEYILTLVPLDLFSVAEALNQFRLSSEVIKMKIKQMEKEAAKASEETSLTRKQEDAYIKTLPDRILQESYSTVIQRVENQISFSRELIMSAKKLWDSRRRGEESNPVSEVNPAMPEEIPDYDPITRKTYIK